MEIFAFSSHTADNHRFAVGGFCNMGNEFAIIEAFRGLENIVFGDYSDPFVIDMRLSRLIREYSAADVFLVGASIRLEKCNQNGGGILGIPGSSDISADGTVQDLGNGFYSLAFPGEFGLAVSRDLPDTFLFVRDGCGDNRGCVVVQSGGKGIVMRV